MSFSQRIFKNTEALLINPTPRQEERLDYAQRFFRGFQMVTRVTTINGYARDLDYNQIDEEELLWLAREIRELPNPDSEINDCHNGPVDIDMFFLRDQVARSLFEIALTKEKIILLPAHRETENYF